MSVIDKFIIGQQDFTPVYRIGQQLENLKATERAKIEKQRQEALGIGKHYDTALSDKDNLTGTPLDPNIRGMLIEARGVVAAMNKNNAGFEAVQSALSPMIGKINEYQLKASQYSQAKTEYLKATEKNKGINAAELSPILDREVFMNPDGSMKDIRDIDVSKFNEIAGNTIAKHADVVTTAAGFEDFANRFKPSTYNAAIDEIDEKGARKKKVYNVEAPEWTTVDQQGKIVPRFTVAYSKDENGDGVPETYNFSKDPKVKDEHPIRLLDEQTFFHLIGNDEVLKARIIAKVRKAGFEGDLRNDDRSLNAARAIAYSELSQFAHGKKTEQAINKEAPAPKTNITIKTGDADQPTVDIWSDFSDKASTGTGFNSTESGIVRSMGNDFTGADEGSDAYAVRKNANGEVEMYAKKDITKGLDKLNKPIVIVTKGQSLGTVDPVMFNAKANKEFGIKAKTKQLSNDQNKKLTWGKWKAANPSGSWSDFQSYLKTK